MRYAMLCGVLLGTFNVSSLACERPVSVEIPDSERIKARVERKLREDMRVYVTEMVSYVNCVREEFTAAEIEDASDEALTQIADEHNSAIEELETVGNAYIARIGSIEELFSVPEPDSNQAQSLFSAESERERDERFWRESASESARALSERLRGMRSVSD